MPIDHTIFMQAAQLKQKDRELLLQGLTDSVNSNLKSKELEIEKEKAAKTAFDLEKLAQQTQVKKEMGIQTSPQEDAALNAYMKFQGAETSVNPVSGDLYPKFDTSVFGGINRGGSLVADDGRPNSDTPFDEGAQFGVPKVNSSFGVFNFDGLSPTIGPEKVPTAGIIPVSMEELEGSAPLGKNPGPPKAPVGFNTEFAAPQITMPSLPVDNPKTRQIAAENVIKNNLELQKEIMSKEFEKNIKKEEGRQKAENRVLDAAAQAVNVDQAIEDAIANIGPNTAGLGSNLKDIPIIGKGTDAFDLEATLNTIKADAAFSELQKMRDNSPTGGALGSTTEKELELLQSSIASLNQGQKPETLKKNLLKYKQQRRESLRRVATAFEKDHGYKPEMPIFNDDKPKKAASWEDYFK